MALFALLRKLYPKQAIPLLSAPRYLLSEGVFSLCWIALRVFPAVRFIAHLQLIRLWLRQRLMRYRFRISPWSSLLRWVLYPCVDSVFFPADSSHGIHYHFIHMLAIATKFISVAVQPFVPPHRRSYSNKLCFLLLRPLVDLILSGFLHHT